MTDKVNYTVLVFSMYFHHRCESMSDTLPSLATNQGDNTVLVAQGGTATPGTTKQLLPPDRVFKRNICISKYTQGYMNTHTIYTQI